MQQNDKIQVSPPKKAEVYRLAQTHKYQLLQIRILAYRLVLDVSYLAAAILCWAQFVNFPERVFPFGFQRIPAQVRSCRCFGTHPHECVAKWGSVP